MARRNLHPHYQSDRESQQADPVETYFPKNQPDVIGLARIARIPASHRLREGAARHIVRPGGITFIDWGGTIQIANTVQIAIPQNDRRKRWIIGNYSTAALQGIAAAESLFLKFKQSATSFYELPPGATWDDSGSEICTDDIVVYAATVGHIFAASEGVPLSVIRDEELKS